MTIRFDISEMPALQRWVGTKVEKGIRRGMVSAAVRTVSHIQTQIIPKEKRVPVDRGLYKAGWKWFAESSGAVLVYNGMPHASLIEDGVRGSNVKVGRKMLEALAGWAKRKGLVGGKQKSAPKESDLPKAARAQEPPSSDPKDFVAFPEVEKLVKKLKKAIRDLLRSNTKKGGENVAQKVSETEALRVAWAIAMSMKQKGIFNEGKGLKIAARARDAMLKTFLPEELRREIEREFK